MAIGLVRWYFFLILRCYSDQCLFAVWESEEWLKEHVKPLAQSGGLFFIFNISSSIHTLKLLVVSYRRYSWVMDQRGACVSETFGIMDIRLFKLSSCTFDILLHKK